jgi:hypothetical protein
MKNLEDFKKELEVIQLEHRLEIVQLNPARHDATLQGVCCCDEVSLSRD